MTKIKDIEAREILDSRGNPTVEADVITEDGFGRASVPSGASTGKHEAVELRDGGDRYHGKGVQKAVENIETKIKKKLVGLDVNSFEADEKLIHLDGTEQKRHLGANATLAVSLAAIRAMADERNLELHEFLSPHAPKREEKMPTPLMNVINGGEHADNGLDVQEFMILPVADTFKESLRIGSEIYHILQDILKERFGENATNVGDEGGFAPPLEKTEEALDLLMEAIEESGHRPGEDVKLGLDAAASEFYENGEYQIDGLLSMESREMEKMWLKLLKKYPIHVLEDPFHEDDFESFASLTDKTDELIVGDDLFVTHPKRIRKGIEKNAANAVILKPNQIGTLSEALEAAKVAKRSGYKVIVSHRSGETTDPFIADLAVALGADGIKAGAPARGERTAKYNR
ncbi:MAG: phosphopyruvate hydratase, partial [Candidatus Aenigmatarchaeota archaeon]